MAKISSRMDEVGGFPASPRNYYGPCTACLVDITEGQRIRKASRNGYTHVNCATVPEVGPASVLPVPTVPVFRHAWVVRGDELSRSHQKAPPLVPSLPDFENRAVEMDSHSWTNLVFDVVKHLSEKADEAVDAGLSQIKSDVKVESDLAFARVVDKTNNLMKVVEERLRSEFASLTHRIQYIDRDGKLTTTDLAHEKMPILLKYMQLKKHVYMWSPEPGTGKSHAAAQAARILGIEFSGISLNKGTFQEDIVGYKNATTGEFVETEFFRLFADRDHLDTSLQGGLYCFDEMDNTNGNVLTSINTALSNGFYPFKCGVRQMHPNFRCVGTGNTTGRGGDMVFQDRSVLDGATMSRFITLRWDIDWRLTKALTHAVCPSPRLADAWFDWIRQTYTHCKTAFPELVVSPRACFQGIDMLQLRRDELSTAEVAEATVFKGYEEAARKQILATCPLSQVDQMRQAA